MCASKRNCSGTSNAKNRDLYCVFLIMVMNERGYKIRGPHWNALHCYSNGTSKVNSSRHKYTVIFLVAKKWIVGSNNYASIVTAVGLLYVCKVVENLSRIMSKCIHRHMERQKKIVVCRPNLRVYNILLLTDCKQCFGISVLNRVVSYRQPVASTPCLWSDHWSWNGNTLYWYRRHLVFSLPSKGAKYYVYYYYYYYTCLTASFPGQPG